MTAACLGQVVGALGFILLVHSGYSMYEHRAYLSAMAQESSQTRLPLDIVIECLVAALLCAVGAVYVTAPLKPILLDVETRKLTIDGVDSRSSFHVFNHRGHALLAPRVKAMS